MADQIPTIGRIVQYTLTDQDAETINRRRRFNGALFAGNAVQAGDVFPMMISKVWDSSGTDPNAAVNGQLFLDGNDSYWITSVTAGEGERHYAWPVTV